MIFIILFIEGNSSKTVLLNSIILLFATQTHRRRINQREGIDYDAC